MDTTYGELGIRTPSGAYWLLCVMLVLGVTVDALFAARTHLYVNAAVAATWMLGTAIGVIRALRILASLPHDREAARLAFQVTIALILSIVPLTLLLLP